MASKRHARQRTCTTKRGHDNADAARNHARWLSKRDPFGQKWVAYRCKFCGLWHVGRPRK